MVKYCVEKNGGYICWVKVFFLFMSEKKLDIGDSKVIEMCFVKEWNYVLLLFKFRVIRWMVICFVIEEEDIGNGMIFVDFWRYLVVCYILKKVGLL